MVEQMDQASIFAHLQDKDSFIVKLPHKFKEYLADRETFSLTKRDAEIGRIVDTGVNPEHRGPSRPTIEELLAPVDNKQDYLMKLNLPRQVIVEEDDSRKKRSEPESKRVKTVVDEVYFDISFPSVSEIADFKRTRNQMYTLELQEQDDSAILKVKGQLKHRVVGEARINPRDLRSWDLINIDGLTQEEITARLKTDDTLKMRNVARVEDIQNPIAPPGNINLVSISEENERRVALPEEQLKRLVINLFTTEKDAWKVEEMAQRLDQPRQPVKNVMQVLCTFDKIRKVYNLKSSVMAHSWKK